MIFYKKYILLALLAGLWLFIHPYKAHGADATTERNISIKLQQIHKYIAKQAVSPSFEEIFLHTVKSFKGTPYEGYGHDPIGPERLIVKTDQLGCVSLIELSLAIARVAYCGDNSPKTVLEEIQKMRYRGGQIMGFPSRLHYFSEWLDQAIDNHILADRTMDLGGRTMSKEFNWVTAHKNLYPPVTIKENRLALREVEKNLSQKRFPVIPQNEIAAIEPLLNEGDLIAIITEKQGIIVSHVGMVTLLGQKRHIFHASSHLKRVGISSYTISNYVHSKNERIGIRVSRVVAPICPLI